MDWLHQVIGPDGEKISALQMIARGVLIFSYGLILVRVAGHRIFGKMGAFDIVLSVIVGSNLSRAMTGTAPFLSTLATTTAIVLLHWLLARLAVHSHRLGWLIKGSDVDLLRDGRLDRRAMARHGISEGDIEEATRMKGHQRLDQIAEAHLERNGSISIIGKD